MNLQCSYWFLTINENAECFNNFKDVLNALTLENSMFEYSYIYHSIIEDDDSEKTKHYHLVLYFGKKIKRFTTIQNLFKGSHIENTNKSRYYRCIQYLIHKNDITKTQYKISDIVSNIETSLLNDIINSDGYEFDLFDCTKLQDYLFDAYIKNSMDMFYFINRFGLDAIKNYYFIIKDLLKDFKYKYSDVAD